MFWTFRRRFLSTLPSTFDTLVLLIIKNVKCVFGPSFISYYPRRTYGPQIVDYRRLGVFLEVTTVVRVYSVLSQTLRLLGRATEWCLRLGRLTSGTGGRGSGVWVRKDVGRERGLSSSVSDTTPEGLWKGDTPTLEELWTKTSSWTRLPRLFLGYRPPRELYSEYPPLFEEGHTFLRRVSGVSPRLPC